MKNKKQKSARSDVSTAGATSTDLKSLIHEHSLFFDKLIELIPSRFYLPIDDAKPWFQGLSKTAKAAAKQQTKDNIKKARRDRHDPEKSQATTLDLLKQSIESEKGTNNSNAAVGDESDIKPMNLDSGDNRSVTYEELRQRLHRRIEQLRGNRGSSEKLKNEKGETRENQQKKRKRATESEEKSGGVRKSEDEIDKEATEAMKEIEFGKVKIGGEEETGRKKKKRKLPKAKELERAKRLQEAKKDPEIGEKVAKNHSWKAATSRAAGIKVHDDSKLLKQSIQKQRKRHEKNAGKWKERVETREKMKEEKQKKRAGNIAERIHQKKMRKIAKREKKLMRPGFEGRKEGYINEG